MKFYKTLNKMLSKDSKRNVTKQTQKCNENVILLKIEDKHKYTNIYSNYIYK